jgi:hypothetical protein
MKCPETKSSNPTTGLLTLLWAHSPFREILSTGMYHEKKSDGLFPKGNSETKMVLRFKYATWNVRQLGEKTEELDRTFNEHTACKVKCQYSHPVWPPQFVGIRFAELFIS